MTRCPHCGKDFDEDSLIQDEPTRQKQAEEIYALYPRKIAAKPAKQKIMQALKRISFDELKRRTAILAVMWDNADLQFLAHPATWYGQERYLDAPETWAPQRKAAPSGPPLWKQIEQLEKAIETHGANPRYVGYRSDTVTPAMREELKGLRAKLAKLQQEQVASL